MEDLLIFFRWFFPAMWQFFKIPFPLLGMTVGQVLIAASCVVFSFSLLGMLLRVSIGNIRDTGNFVAYHSKEHRPIGFNTWSDSK